MATWGELDDTEIINNPHADSNFNINVTDNVICRKQHWFSEFIWKYVYLIFFSTKIYANYCSKFHYHMNVPLCILYTIV